MPPADRSCLVYKTISAILALALVVMLGLAAYCCLGLWRVSGVKLTAAEQQWLALNSQNLKVSAVPGAPPVAFWDQGHMSGMVSDYYRLIEKRLGVRFKRVPVDSFAQMMELAARGELDVVAPVARTTERCGYLLFSEPVIEYPAVIVTRSSDRRNLRLEDLRGRRIAVTKGYAIWEYLLKFQPDFDYIPVKNDSEGLRLLTFGRVDAVIADLDSASYLIRKLALANLNIAGQLEYRYALSFASQRTKPELNAILSKALASISQRERDQIFWRWVPLQLGPFHMSFQLRLLVVGLLVTALAALVTVAHWNKSLSRRVDERTAELNAYREQLEQRVRERTAELENALAAVKTLSDFIPICSCCRKLRDDEGYWNQIDDYLARHSNSMVTHGICPECLRKLYPEYVEDGPAPAGDDKKTED